MKKNMGLSDQIIRILLAVILISLYFTGIVTGVLGIVSLVAATILALTSLVSSCPLYSLFGISTCPIKRKNV